MPTPNLDQIREARKMWRPHFPECAEPCASCPFRNDNDEALRAKLQALFPTIDPDIHHTRVTVKLEVQFSGNFGCHFTVFDGAGGIKPMAERRQCAGAAAWFRNGGFAGEE